MPTRLTIRQLQMIRALEQAGSVSDAAHLLQVSQSALSHRIREAERLLDTALYLRQNKRLIATSAGQRIQYAARLILAELEHAEQDITQLGAGVAHNVRLGLQVYASSLWLPELMVFMQHKHPDISVQLCADKALDPLLALRRHDIDLALVSGEPGADEFDWQKLFTDQLVAVGPSQHPWQTLRQVTPAAIRDEVYIAHHTNPEVGREYERIFKAHDLLPRRVIRAGVTEAVLAMVSLGLGVTVLPAWTAQQYAQQFALCMRPIAMADMAINWYLVTTGGMWHKLERQAVLAGVRHVLPPFDA
ncbi:MAG: LysR family transcriptional regulator [Gammaproteobacteria bacterium]|jgi:LysR family transcriptional regulator for metE and metH|nr:LysR family transcriptional regulator [Gammaproteobacteria bacterium]